MDRRVQFDFEVDFSNGGGLQGQGFRLDIDGEDIADDELGRLHHPRPAPADGRRGADPRQEDHPRAPQAERARRRPRVTRARTSPRSLEPVGPALLRSGPPRADELARIDLLDTGTYIDTRSTAIATAVDLPASPLDGSSSIAQLRARRRSRGADPLRRRGTGGAVHTGWDRHWRTDAYFKGHPFLTAAAAADLVARGARFVGIDSLNIDDTDDGLGRFTRRCSPPAFRSAST